MIRRARPKHLNAGSLAEMDIDVARFDLPPHELFLNSGSYGLQLMLEVLSQYKQKPALRVAVQSFNCYTVIDAILRAKAKAVLLDIRLEDFSIDLSALTNIEPPDVLVLTHYQGIPNREYQAIIDYCQDHDIFVVDDICQTEGTTINEIQVGQLADVAIHSYAFDKPFTSLQGGSLSLNHLPAELEAMVRSRYGQLPVESETNAKLEIEVLEFMLRFSDPDTYDVKYDDYDFIKVLKGWHLPETVLQQLLASMFVKRVFGVGHKVLGVPKQIIRLNPRKIALVLWQRQNAHKFPAGNIVASLEDWLLRQGYRPIRIENALIKWNRYSIYDPTDRLRDILSSLGIQAGNQNWPVPMHEKYKGHPSLEVNGGFPNTELASAHVVNIPIWYDFCAILGSTSI